MAYKTTNLLKLKSSHFRNIRLYLLRQCPFRREMQRAFSFDNLKKQIYEQRRDQNPVNIAGVYPSDANRVEGQSSERWRIVYFYYGFCAIRTSWTWRHNRWTNIHHALSSCSQCKRDDWEPGAVCHENG